jgi:hypothetical protein
MPGQRSFVALEDLEEYLLSSQGHLEALCAEVRERAAQVAGLCLAAGADPARQARPGPA